MTTRIALMGRIRAGKDHVADGTSLQKHRMADPLYHLMVEIFGPIGKETPGFRRLLQQTGQFGRGIINSAYPLTFERAAFIGMVRSLGPKTPGLEKVDWSSYGKDESFWAKALINSSPTNVPESNVIINDLRFQIDKTTFEEAGFTSFLVLCTEETRKERLLANNEHYDGIFPSLLSDFGSKIATEHQTCDVSESLAVKLSNIILFPDIIKGELEIPLCHVIWNDHREPPVKSLLNQDKSYLTTTQFHQKYTTLK